MTFVRENLPGFSFRDNMDSNIDWQAWEELSKREGEFVYIPVSSMEHRIHPGIPTSSVLKDDRRKAEDMAVLEKFFGEGAWRLLWSIFTVTVKNPISFQGRKAERQ